MFTTQQCDDLIAILQASSESRHKMMEALAISGPDCFRLVAQARKWAVLLEAMPQTVVDATQGLDEVELAKRRAALSVVLASVLVP
jgi:hypothetical protein